MNPAATLDADMVEHIRHFLDFVSARSKVSAMDVSSVVRYAGSD
jgi:hypothetical protein